MIHHIKKTAGPKPRRRDGSSSSPKSAQELQNALVRLVGERERGDRDRLAGRQRLAVGRFLVGIGQGQVGRPGLQHVDQVLREVLTDLHDREVGTEGRSLRAQRGAGGVERCQNRVRRCVIVEVDLPVSLNTSFSVSPLSRLTPLKDESCAVVVICWMIWLYWATRLERAVCDTASAVGAVTSVPAAA